MKRAKLKSGQGEIFGVALMFVVIIIGILIYSQIKALTPDREADLEAKAKYELLAQSSLEAILKSSTKCNVDGSSGTDSIQDLINVCLAGSYGSSDVEVVCDDNTINLCAETTQMLEDVLNGLYSGDDALIGNIPFFVEIELPSDSYSPLTSRNVTNFGNFTFRDTVITSDNYRKYGFKKASSDLKPWATAQRSIKMTLALYYR